MLTGVERLLADYSSTNQPLSTSAMEEAFASSCKIWLGRRGVDWYWRGVGVDHRLRTVVIRGNEHEHEHTWKGSRKRKAKKKRCRLL